MQPINSNTVQVLISPSAVLLGMSNGKGENVLILYPNNDLGFQVLHIKELLCQNGVAKYKNMVLIAPYELTRLAKRHFDTCIVKAPNQIVKYLKRSIESTPNTIILYGFSNLDVIRELQAIEADNVKFLRKVVTFADINSGEMKNQYDVLNKINFICGKDTIKTLQKHVPTHCVDEQVRKQAICELIDIDTLSEKERKILQLD